MFTSTWFLVVAAIASSLFSSLKHLIFYLLSFKKVQKVFKNCVIVITLQKLFGHFSRVTCVIASSISGKRGWCRQLTPKVFICKLSKLTWGAIGQVDVHVYAIRSISSPKCLTLVCLCNSKYWC